MGALQKGLAKILCIQYIRLRTIWRARAHTVVEGLEWKE